MQIIFRSAAIITAGLLGTTITSAHHSFSAEFDGEQQVTFTGTVTNVEWTNPHARFYVDAPDPDMDSSEPVGWNIELASAAIMMRQGLGPNTLEIGSTVTVCAARARVDPHVVNASAVLDTDGERIVGQGFGGNNCGQDSSEE